MKKANKKIKYRKFLKNREKKILKKRHRKHKKGKKIKKFNIVNTNVNILSQSEKIISVLKERKFGKKVRRTKNQNEIIIIVPRIFSFIKNPDETILTLRKIFYAGINKHIKSICFNYSNCEELGLCASLLTDLIILSLPRYQDKSIRLSGNAPNSYEARKLFNVTGLTKHIGISNQITEDSEILDILSNIDSDIMSEKVVSFYNNCLKKQGYTLTDMGKNYFSNIVGEVIDNSKQYSGKNGTWHVLGFYDRPERGKSYGKCRLVLMNFGNSIYESLKATDTTEYTRNQLENHTKKNYNIIDKFSYTEELLWTLYTLQQNVSKKRTDKNDDRGKGTIKLIDSFMAVGVKDEEYKSLMSITSGKCQIFFDGKYKLEKKIKDGKECSQIAFNKANDLNMKPDKDYVYNLKNKFPGTVISMEICLDNRYLNQLFKLKGEK